jgi:hypothetical protein
MDEIVSLEGPLEMFNGQLALRIPLVAGGDKLAPFAGRIGTVDGEYLNVVGAKSMKQGARRKRRTERMLRSAQSA